MSLRRNTAGVFALLYALTTAALSHADLSVRFIEGAPKDRFILKNTGNCTISNASIRLDLSASIGKLIFDVTDQGEGVDVFQPFNLTEGRDSLRVVPSVRDGQSVVQLDIVSLESSAAIIFTIDVDDTIGQRETIVSGAEIEGATVTYKKAEQSLIAAFSADAEAFLDVPDC